LRALQEQMPLGHEGNVLVRVRDASNRERGLTLPRRVGYRDALPTFERPDGMPVRVLSDGTVYVDVERLTDSTVDVSLAQAASARAIVLDLRGPVAIDDTRLLRRFATRPRATVARVVQRTLTAPCLTSIREAAVECPDVRDTRQWWREVDTSSVLRGRLVALIDERTQGAAERLALSLEQLSNVTFIGSPSAGAVSWTTPLSLPGGLTVGLATQELRRADGGQVQRVGITPLIEARPTAAGVRAGADEVLTRAQQWLQQQLNPSARRRP
jgi:C-terminal processing protease CtpA/Prc